MNQPRHAPESFAPRDLRPFFREVYRDADVLTRLLAVWRPAICPFEPIVRAVPHGSRVLDFGCGSGALLALLAASGRISAGVGCDISEAAIGTAARAQARLSGHTLDFRCISDLAESPRGPFDVVLMIDVLHHIPAKRQQEAMIGAAERVARGGRLIYKDMVSQPAWRRLANTLHDLLLARQLVSHAPIAAVENWLREAGLSVTQRSDYSRLVYGHELRVFQKDA